MPPKGGSTQLNPVRLQSVAKIRIRRPDKQAVNPCLGIMSAMLSRFWSKTSRITRNDTRLTQCTIACWASSGLGNESCMAAEQSLRECMDVPVSSHATHNLKFDELLCARPADLCLFYSDRHRREKAPSITIFRGCIPT
jgi:hypothetical protein